MSAFLIENGRIIDGAGNAPVHGAVLINSDKILATGSEAEAQAAQLNVDTRIDATGMSVMPGLIDMHCHLAFDNAESNSELFFQRRNALSALVAAYNAKMLLRAGVTGILDPDSTFENMIDLRDAIDAGVADGPRMSCGAYALITSIGGTAGRMIRDSGVTGYYMAVNGRDEIIGEVRRQIKNGADWIKVHVTGIVPRQSHKGEMCAWSDDELRLIVDTAHDLETPVMGHCRGADATRRAALAGFDLLFHATGMDEAALDAVIERKIPIAPTLTFQANMADFGPKIGANPDLMKLFESELADSAEAMRKAYDNGVPLLTGSEAGFSMVPYGDWHYRELEVFVRYFGLTPLQAIQCATEQSAFGLKMYGETGVVAPGYKADLIVVDGDPSLDVTVLGKPGAIRHVIVDGAMKDLTPLPPRRPIPGWRVASIGRQLTREIAFGENAADDPIDIEELH